MATRRVLAVGAVLAAVALAPLVLPPFTITLLNYIGLAALVTLGLVVMTGVAGIVSFGQQAFVGIAAYASAALTTIALWSPWAGLLAAIGLVLACALPIGAVTLRLSGHYLSIATIAWSVAIFYLFGNLELLGKYSGLDNVPPVHVGTLAIDTAARSYLLIWSVLLAALAGAANLLDSRSGRAIRALRSRAAMAESFGVDTGTLRLVVFVYAALLAAVAGWLQAHFLRFVSPHAFGVNAGIDYLFMAVIGGAGQVWGAVVGAGVMTLAKEWLKDLLPRLVAHTGNYETIVFGVLMIVLLQRTREGLVPVLARWVPRRPAPAADLGAAPLPRRERPAAGTTLLEVQALRKCFGGLVAVDGVDFTLRAGEILGLIGPNGAGKSTVFNLISGALAADGGSVNLGGQRIDGTPPRAVARRGLARSFQHVHLIGRMSVLDNVALGAHLRTRAGVWAAMLRRERTEEARLRAEALRCLERVGLAAQAHDAAGSLALGSQRLVEIARALAADPLVLLLDEPAAGLRFAEKQALAATLAALRQAGVAILLVEHDMDFVMGLVDRLVVMDFGQKIAEGEPAAVQRDPAVVEAYLGGLE